MKILKIVLIVVAVIAIALVSLYAYYGGFKKVEFKQEEQGGEILVYKEVVGDYSQTPQVQEKVYKALLNEEKIQTYKGFGIYYDDPKQVEKSKLRSEVGCILEAKDSASIATLSAKYKVKVLPKSNCVVTEFPFKGGMSVLVGLMKVYPALEKYCQQEKIGNAPIMEIYDMPNGKIIYRKEIIKTQE